MTRLLTGHRRRVFAIETDAQLARALREETRAHPAQWLGVEIVPGDVLTLDLAKLAGGRFRAYATCRTTSHRRSYTNLFGCADQIASAHLVIQMDVAGADRSASGTPRIRLSLGRVPILREKPAMTLRLPPGAFRPPPRVTSALLEMVLPGERATLGISDENASWISFECALDRSGKPCGTTCTRFCSDHAHTRGARSVRPCFKRPGRTTRPGPICRTLQPTCINLAPQPSGSACCKSSITARRRSGNRS